MEESRWYAVHTYSSYEKKVSENLMKVVKNRNMQDQILEVRVPTDDVISYRAKPVKKKKEIDKDWDVEPIVDAYTKEWDEKHKDNKSEEKKTEVVEKIIQKKRFPGYVFVKIGVEYDSKSGEMKMTDETWSVIRQIRGVTGFTGSEGNPKPLTETEVIKIGLNLPEGENADSAKIEVEYNVGDHVIVLDGAFDGMTGVVRKIDINNKSVTIDVAMFGGATVPVETAISMVALVTDE